MSVSIPSDRPPKDDDSCSTHSEDSDISNEEGWEDVEPDDETQPVVGLFSEKVYPDVLSMLQETKDKYNFDLRRIQKELGVYLIDWIGLYRLSISSAAQARLIYAWTITKGL